MPNLVGIGNSQVPTNGMLGGLAYQDPAHANLTSVEIENIAKMNGEIDAPGSLRQLFVYDTSRDSDGGAWRKRCQDTSWFNEDLGGKQRGHRREFPAVAILAATSNGLYIYDGDDPNFPMWMVFEVNNNYWLKHTISGSNCACVHAMNGMVVTGGGTSGRLCVQNFPADNGYVTEQSYTYTHDYISRRNYHGIGPITSDTFSRAMGDHYPHDIAMFVQPWAPINQDSGLPTPTIMVGTTGGVIFINDGQIGHTLGETGNGKVIRGTSSSNTQYSLVESVTTTDTGWCWWNGDTDPQRDTWLIKKELQSRISGNFTWSNSADTFSIPIQDGNNYDSGKNTLVITTSNEAGNYEVGYANDFRLELLRNHGYAGPRGWGFWTLPVEHSHYDNSGRGMTSMINSYSTTGLVPNLKNQGAVYAGTTDYRTLGNNQTNILTNGDFSNGTTGWYGDSGAAVSESGGVATVTNGGGDNTFAIKQNDVFRVGRKYKVKATVTPTFSGSYTFRVRAGGSGVQWSITSGLTSGSAYTLDTGVIVADGTPLEIGSVGGNITSFTIDNIQVYDMSVQDLGNYRHTMDVYGALKCAQVSMGSELAGIGPFTTSNYAKAPVSANYGSPATLTMCGWFRTTYTSGYQYICSLGDGSSTNSAGLAIETSNGGLYFYDGASENWSTHYLDDSKNVRDGEWHHVAGVYDAGVRKALYRDGNPVISRDPSGSLNLAGVTEHHLGYYSSNNSSISYPFGSGTDGCQVALVKFSKTALTDEQIKLMYETEKHLFYENAKCTLYGTSDEVTALAYDYGTKNYHVGTSAGRSDFHGLRRINNTTTPVTTTISACNGLIVDQ